jgi:peptidoglycan/LPS O-acetylase OafA/YrhL
MRTRGVFSGRHVAADGHSFGLDLARFLAVSLVLITHCSVMFLSIHHQAPPVFVLMSAFFGVELFFVLSGFLIGRLLFRVAETDPSPRGWLVFMARRWLRTLPLYFVWLGVLASVLPTPPDFGWHLLRYATMTQNLAWPMPVDHWFNETWSLAVEEWFYLLFSAALLGAVAWLRGTRAIWPVILLFLAVPPILRAMRPAGVDFEEQIYHVALFRLDAIAYGVALARLHRGGSRLFAHPKLALAAGVALVGFCWIWDATPFRLPVPVPVFLQLQLLAVSIGLCLCLVGLLRLRPPVRPLAWVVTTGARMSYGVYLMHLTIIGKVAWMAAERGLGLRYVAPVSLALIVLLPYLSYRFFEAPLLSLRPRSPRPAALVAAGSP